MEAKTIDEFKKGISLISSSGIYALEIGRSLKGKN